MERSDDFCLVTPRLLLRDYVEDDLPDVHAFRSNPEVARFMEFSPEDIV
jgi:RimJ/RimL family protein N-acetyltransferase